MLQPSRILSGLRPKQPESFRGSLLDHQFFKGVHGHFEGQKGCRRTFTRIDSQRDYPKLSCITPTGTEESADAQPCLG